MFAIIISTMDFAGLNIKANLLSKGFKDCEERFEGEAVYQKGNIKIYTTNLRSIVCENFDELIPAELFVIATTHRSAAGTHSLSVHAPGNWGQADLGGVPGELCIAPALYIKRAFEILNELGKDSGYEITMEVTHHGPLLKRAPCLFIEIGSSEEQWQDQNAGRIIAETILRTLESKPTKGKVCLGLGGGHYAPYFNKLQLKEGYAIGHICPKYALEHLTPELLTKAMERTEPRANLIIFDEKGMGERKQEILGWIKELGIEAIGCRKIEK
jgi:D-aminoacyl-tRNA deacylase